MLSRDTFEHFFHINVHVVLIQGLWGEAVFNAFDSKKEGSIAPEKFECMLSTQPLIAEMLARGNADPRLKADVLFRFYDVHSDNMVSYQELLKMVGLLRYSSTATPKTSLWSYSMTNPYKTV